MRITQVNLALVKLIPSLIWENQTTYTTKEVRTSFRGVFIEQLLD